MDRKFSKHVKMTHEETFRTTPGYKINIDERMYELYGLTFDEIAIVEGKSQ